MVRTMLRPALALGAVLAVGGVAAADDTVRLGGAGAKSGFGGATLSLAGNGAIADAAAADTELTGGCRRFYGGGGCGFNRGFGGYGGFCATPVRFYGGGCNFRPCFTPNYCFRPAFRPVFATPVFYGGGFGGFNNCGNFGGFNGFTSFGGGYCNQFRCISGSQFASVPAVTLTLSSARTAPVFNAAPVPQAPPAAAPATFPHEGPTFTPPVRPAPTDEILVSKKAAPAAKPYTYKAYGEK